MSSPTLYTLKVSITVGRGYADDVLDEELKKKATLGEIEEFLQTKGRWLVEDAITRIQFLRRGLPSSMTEEFPLLEVDKDES